MKTRVLLVLIVCALGLGTRDLVSCAYAPPDPHFVEPKGPGAPGNSFADGELGILLPTYDLDYLVVAYRYLNGMNMGAGEKPTLGRFHWDPMRAQAPEPHYVKDGCASQAICDWMNARETVPDLRGQGPVNPYKPIPGQYSSITNCNDDAFTAAKGRVEDDLRRYGKTSGIVHDWTAAQDQVFGNCAAGGDIPEPLPAGADGRAKAERKYQIAAAYFYSGDYDKARTAFDELSHDPASPDRALAPYLVARSLIRKEDYTGAEKLLTSLVQSANDKSAKRRAQSLLNFVHVHSNPLSRMLEVSRDLESQHPDSLEQDVTDYVMLYDKVKYLPLVPRSPVPATPPFLRDPLHEVAEKEDLTAWIDAFKDGDHNRSLAEWKNKRTSPWLIAALRVAKTNDAEMRDLLESAKQIRTNDAGYLSVNYYAALLLEREGQTESARSLLNTVRAKPAPTAAINLLLAERMKVAPTWSDFLHDVQRRSANPNEFGKLAPDTPLLDGDGADVFNSMLGLTELAAASRSEALSLPVRKAVASAAWTRAILLNRLDMATGLSADMAGYFPQSASQFEAFKAAEPKAQPIEATWIFLHNPGLKPWVEGGFGRGSRLDEIDNFRDNWWCFQPVYAPDFNSSYTGNSDNDPVHPRSSGPTAPLLFLTPEQNKAAAKEVGELSKAHGAPHLLGEQVMAWAKENPSDPRLPEALHLVVRSTRYGCVHPSDHYSKGAFDLLHRRYPNSVWTKRTPYWFDE